MSCSADLRQRSTRAVRDFAVVLALIAVHEVLRRYLAGNAVISALFAPNGDHARLTLFLGLFFELLRVALFVIAPGWLTASMASTIAAQILDPGQRDRRA